MTMPPHGPTSYRPPTSSSCPYGTPPSAPVSNRLLPIHGAEFSADPRATYARLRAQGPIAPCELDRGVYAYITTTYRAALYLLRNTPTVFLKNPVHWQALRKGQVPADSPALMMMQPRQNALWLDGGAHSRLRSAITDSLEWVDTHALAASVARIADDLLTRLVNLERPDLVADFADALPMQVLIDMFGCPLDLGHAIVGAIAKLFDTTQDAAQANADLEAACLALTRLKRDHPGYDVTSWLVAHPARLTDEEMIQQILLVIGAGTTPCTNLIANALLLLITDDRFSGDVHTGVRPVSHALDQVLWEDPPISNYCPLYLREEHIYEGVRLLPGVPILVSFAAANSDPALAAGADRRAGNRAHLAFSAGIRACPAPDLARVISETAIERVLDRLPDLALNCSPSQLMRRPGTFHSGWTHLPVTFPRTAPAGTYPIGGSR
ncbi:cytochrome P450 [Streptomyces prunicolor]|uniref:cytochrome P450 n=1 Tax=Streptomyces prunicolor TaxID=67348 RepID=UPI000372E0AB|nr:cytochrome P450 [Streptomyces prunicolor]